MRVFTYPQTGYVFLRNSFMFDMNLYIRLMSTTVIQSKTFVKKFMQLKYYTVCTCTGMQIRI